MHYAIVAQDDVNERRWAERGGDFAFIGSVLAAGIGYLERCWFSASNRRRTSSSGISGV